jgi:hypothetical protein
MRLGEILLLDGIIVFLKNKKPGQLLDLQLEAEHLIPLLTHPGIFVLLQCGKLVICNSSLLAIS